MAADFKHHLESTILEHIPDFAERVNRFTSKTIPGDFLEIRAYPESVYNLRPDQILMEGGILDREPFPQIGDDQWISPDHSSAILYSSGESAIYPFKLDGRIVGEDMNRYILSHAEQDMAQRAVGAILLKPDALERNQVGAIKEILRSKIAKFGGKIVFEKLLDGLTYSQVVEVYPALSGEDLRDAAEYLASGPNLGIVIEGPLDEAGVMREINNIKGPRVGDRSVERLLEGRVTNGTLRDLLPVQGDESLYQDLLPTILERKANPEIRFTKDQYAYYSRNLVHTPDNAIELRGLLNVIGYNR
jgi:nucleoside diphosphate kinase